MPATTPTRPARVRSSASAPSRGFSRTRLPRRTATPLAITTSGLARSTSRLSESPATADRAVQTQKVVGRQAHAPLDDGARVRIGGRHVLTLLVGERQDVEDQQLIDL